MGTDDEISVARKAHDDASFACERAMQRVADAKASTGRTKGATATGKANAELREAKDVLDRAQQNHNATNLALFTAMRRDE